MEAAPKHLIIVDGAIMQPIPEHPKRDYIFCLSTAFGDAYLFQAPCQVSGGGNSGGWATVDELNKLGSPSSVRLSCVAIRTSNKKQQLSVIHSRIPFAKSLTGIESFHHNSVENHEVFTRNDTLFMATRSNSTFQK